MDKVIPILLLIGFCVLIIGVAYYVSTQGPTPEEIQNFKNVLPENCEIHDIGSYGQIDQLVVVTCDAQAVEVTQMYDRHGKTHEENAIVWIH